MFYADHRDYITLVGFVYADANIAWNRDHGVQMWKSEADALAAIDAEARTKGRLPCYQAEYMSNGESYGLCWSDRAPQVYTDAVGKMTGRLVGPFDSYQEALEARPKNRTYGRM